MFSQFRGDVIVVGRDMWVDGTHEAWKFALNYPSIEALLVTLSRQ